MGRFRATGIRPRFISRLKSFGISVREDLFSPTRVFE
jgi:pilus assembly protein CpaF